MVGCGKDKNDSERQKWHDKLDEVWDMTDRTFDKFSNSISDWGLRDLEDTIGSSLPWINSTFNSFGSQQDNSKLWAFPVPSARQYDQCKEAQGESAWSKEGVWRCLFNNENKKEPDNWFTEYSKYLDWRRQMRKNVTAQREKEKQQWQSIWRPSSSDGARASSSGVKYISESEAEKAGKKVASSSITSETVTREDGTLETKNVVKKWYDDGTCSLNESTSTKNEDGKGWFWK